MRHGKASAAMHADGAPGANRDKRAPLLRGRTVRSVFVCLVVLAFLAVIPVFVNTAIGYAPIILALLLLLMSFAYLMVLKRCLSFVEEGPDNGCTRGDVLSFALTVENKSLLPVLRLDVCFFVSGLFGAGGTSSVRKLTLPPRSRKTFDLGVRFDHIGRYEIGISQVGIYDPLGVFYSERQNDKLHSVEIVPRLFDVDTLALADDAQKESIKNVKTYMSDGMDYSGVREYRWGDPIKAIHWKLSSKTLDTYFTRLYEMPTTPGVVVFCDFEASGLTAQSLMDVYDALVESAFSIVRYALANGYEAELLFVDSMGESRRFTGPLESYSARALESMPLMHEGRGNAVRELLRKESSSMYCQHNVVVCTSNADEAMANSLLGVASSRLNPMLLAVNAGESAPSETNSANEAGCPSADADTAKRTIRRLSSVGIWCKSLKSASELKRSA